METERTKDRRLLREKRLAYFDKVGNVLKQQPPLPQETACPISSESKEIFSKNQTGEKGNTSARKSSDQSRSLKKGVPSPSGKNLEVTNSSRKNLGITNGVLTQEVGQKGVSSPSRRNLGITSGGTTQEGDQQAVYKKNIKKLEPGARPKIRNYRHASNFDDMNVLSVSRNHAIRKTFDLEENERKQGPRSNRNAREFSDKYESVTGSRDGNLDVDLAPVSVPMVIPAEHGLFKMGTKEQVGGQVKENDLHEVFRLERRYDYPRGRDHVGHSYQDAQKAAVEHNAFGVDSMLHEMRQVRRVKAKLHEQLRESFDKFGSVSMMLGKGNRVNERNVGITELDESTNIVGDQNNLAGNVESDIQVSEIDFNESYENLSNQNEMEHSLLERKNHSFDNQTKEGVLGHNETGCIVHAIEEDEAQTKQVLSNPGGESNQGVLENEFNLGALCAAAKQGDDILKDYIKRLTQKILNNKDNNEGTTNSHLDRSKVMHSCHSKGQLLADKLINTTSHGVTHEFAKFSNEEEEEEQLFTSNQLRNQTVLETSGSKIQSAIHSSDLLNNLACFNKSGDCDKSKLDDVLSIDSEGSSQEIHELDALSKQSAGDDSQWDDMGFQTHRPSDHAYSPVKVVRFVGSEENSKHREQGIEFQFQDYFTEGYKGPPGIKESCDTDELMEKAERDLRGYHDKKQRLSFEMEQEYKEQSVPKEDVEQNFTFFRDFKVSDIGTKNGSDLSQQVSQCFHQVDWESSHEMQTEPNEDTKWKSGGSRRPRTPEEHKKGVQRHHQREREKGRLVEVLPEEGDVDRSQSVMQVDEFRLSLDSINTSTEIDNNTFFTEIPSAEIIQDGSNIHNHGYFACISETMEGHPTRYEEDDESVLMEKISQFRPTSVSFVEEENAASNGMVNGYHETMNGSNDIENDSSHPQFWGCKKPDASSQSEVILPPSDDFQDLRIRSSILNSHDQSLDVKDKVKLAIDKGKNGKSSTKLQGVKPKSSVPSQYKCHWPQSSNLIPSRPKKINQKFSCPEGKLSKKMRPTSAKISRETLDRGSKGQKTRPRSAIQQNFSKEPGAGGDFFNVKSSKMFESGMTRASLISGPLTLKLILDSPREMQHHSIWQLLPDEILLCIFSYLRHRDLISCSQVCQGFYRVAMDDSLWRFIHLEKKHLSDYQLTQIGEKRPTSVVFLQCKGKNVTENGLRNLFRTCVDSLQELNVSGCSGEMFSGDSVLLHASRCYNLSNIDASWCNVTDNGLNAMSGGCQRLSSVCLNGCQSVTDAGLRSLIEKHGPSLIVLEVFGCIDLSPLTLERIGIICKNLHSLNIGQCYKVTDESIYEVMPKLKTLRHLDVRGCKQIRDDCVRRIVKSCKRLETLVLANCTFVSNTSMVEIASNLKYVRSLDVSGCKKITSEGVRPVAMCCTKLAALNLSSTSIDRKSISTLASYCSLSLTELKLNFCKDITEAGIIKLLKHCKRMETVHLYGVKGLRNLGLLKLQYPCLMHESGPS